MSFDIVQYSDMLSTLLTTDTPFVIITLVDIRGSAPQITGAKALVTSHGIQAGTIGGGRVEASAIRHAQERLKTQDGPTCELLTWNLQNDIGMTCGGEVCLLFEVCGTSAWSIAVFGAGHISQTLIPMLLQLHCRVTCVDSRPDWQAKLDDHPKLRKQCIKRLSDAVAELPDRTFFLLMSQGHATDLPVLSEILRTRDAPFVGVIGSPQKASILRRDLKNEGISDKKIASFVCPLGLSIGNNTPAEISISVIAQLIQRRDELGILKHKVKDF